MVAVNEGAVHLDETEAEVYRLRVVNRLTQSEIGARLGVTQQRVAQIEASARSKLAPPDLDAIRQESLTLHRESQRIALELAEKIGAPVFVGKDGSMAYDVNGEPVRDYSLRLAALETARKADVEIRKLMGADAAMKTEVSGSVRYEVAGVDLSALS